jgi:ABC-type transport system involved in cytochrome bd biosynthesis fused ATPase/permease subunit
MNIYSIIIASIISLLVITLLNIKKQQNQIMIYLSVLIIFMIYYLVEHYIKQEKEVSLQKLNEISNSLDNTILNEEQKKLDILRSFKENENKQKNRKQICKNVEKIILVQDQLENNKKKILEQNHVLNQKLDRGMDN